jgi:hypothetical protein
MSLKKDLRKFLLGAIAIVPFFGLASTQAHAEVLADALLVLDNFIFHDGTGTAYSTDEIDILSATNFANTGGGGLASVGGNLQQSGFNPIDPPTDTNGDVNLTAISEGVLPAGHGDDSYTAFENPPTTHYAYADADVNGAAIDIITPGGTIPAGVTAQTQAASGLTSDDSGDANANTGLNTTFDFIADVSGELHVSFGFEALVRTSVVGANVDLASALAAVSWVLTVTDLTDDIEFQYSPDEINVNAGSDNINTGTDETSLTGSLSFFLIDLIAGNRYSIQIQHDASADTFLVVQQIPEPGTLLLVGGGLIFLAGFGYVQGRRRSTFQA